MNNNKRTFSIVAVGILVTNLGGCFDAEEESGKAIDATPENNVSTSLGRKCIKSLIPGAVTTTYIGEATILGQEALVVRKENILTEEGEAPQYTFSLQRKDKIYLWSSGHSEGTRANAPTDNQMDVKSMYQLTDHTSFYGKCEQWTTDTSLLSLPKSIIFPK